MNEAVHSFTATQWQHLSGEFHLAWAGVMAGPSASANPTMTPDDLLDVDRCRATLDRVGPVIGSPSRPVTASLLGKRLAFLATGSTLYAMSVLDRGLDLRPANWVPDCAHDGSLWRSHLRLKHLHADPAPADARAAWRERIATGLFAGHLAPLWSALHAASGLAPRILWENTAVRVYSLYERRIPTLAPADRQDTARADIDYLIHAAPAGVFGVDANPLARYFFKPTTPAAERGAAPVRAVRFRKTCCLYYLATHSPNYCSNCPLLLPRPTRTVNV